MSRSTGTVRPTDPKTAVICAQRGSTHGGERVQEATGHHTTSELSLESQKLSKMPKSRAGDNRVQKWWGFPREDLRGLAGIGSCRTEAC